MCEQYQIYLDTISNDTSRRVAKRYKGIEEFDFETCTENDLRNLILSMQPHCLKEFDTIKNNIKSWIKYKYPTNVFDRISDMFKLELLDREKLWEVVKPKTSRKFISHKQYLQILQDIDFHDEANPEYNQALFMSIYEGLYNRSYEVTWNLRGSDVNNNIATIRYNNGDEWDIHISGKLNNILKIISDSYTLMRHNHFGYYSVPAFGMYYDSCFKVEQITSKQNAIHRKEIYNARIRKIAKQYVGYSLTAQQLYISGIMYRIGLKLKDYGISFQEAFKLNSKNKIVGEILKEEFERINAPLMTNNFRENVRGFLDVFEEDFNE